MRPFSTLGLKPFLWAEAADLREIQSKFYERSRTLHPDRTVNLPDEERERLEAEAAMLNADYAKLRDTWKLIETVLASEKAAEAAPRAAKAPPGLAMEYFELQERLEEEGLTESVRNAATELRAQAEAEVKSAEAVVLEFTKKFPYAGFATGDTPTPWTPNDLASLASAMDRVRFARSFLRDFTAKFPTP